MSSLSSSSRSSLRIMRRWGKLLSFLVAIYLYCFQAAARANIPQEDEGFNSDGEETFSQCEIRLLETIFNESNFPNHVRPVDSPEEPIIIQVSFELKTVMDMEEQLQILKTHCGITLIWKDYYRDWDPAKFCNLREIGVESKELWLPDITLLNSASGGDVVSPKPMSASYTGEVTWDGLVIFESFCKIDFSFFPYDEQKCELIFRTWSYPMDKVRLVPGEDLEKDGSMDNGEWDVVQMSSRSMVTLRDRRNYSDLVVTIHMERRPQFYFMNIIIPCFIIYFLTLFGFCLPADSGEKIGLGITILLSLTVFMLISADMMPPTSDNFPLIAQFYTSTMVLVASSIGMSVIVLNFNHRGPKAAKAPKWMRTILLGHLSKILFVSGGAQYGKEKVCQDEKPTYRRNEGPACIEECMDDMCGVNKASNGELMLTAFNNTPTLPRSQSVQGDDRPGLHEKATPSPNSDSCYSNGERSFIERQLRSISTNLQHLVDHHREQDEENEILDEWKLLATAVDRLCLIIFLLGSLILMTTLAGELMRRTETPTSPPVGGDQKLVNLS